MGNVNRTANDIGSQEQILKMAVIRFGWPNCYTKGSRLNDHTQLRLKQVTATTQEEKL